MGHRSLAGEGTGRKLLSIIMQEGTVCGSHSSTLLHLHNLFPALAPGNRAGRPEGWSSRFLASTFSLSESSEAPKTPAYLGPPLLTPWVPHRAPCDEPWSGALDWLVWRPLSEYSAISIPTGAPSTSERNVHVVKSVRQTQNLLVLIFTFNPKKSLSFLLQKY